MLSPGVEVKEFDFFISVPQVSNSIACFAGIFEKGPSNKYTLITNVDELESVYGKPRNFNYNDWYQCYMFLQYGNKLLVSRAVDANGTFLDTNIQVDNASGSDIQITDLGTLQEGDYVKFGSANADDEYFIDVIDPSDDGEKQITEVVIEPNDGSKPANGDYKLRVYGKNDFYEDITYTSVDKSRTEILNGLTTELNNLSSAPIEANVDNDKIVISSLLEGQEFKIEPLNTLLSAEKTQDAVKPSSYTLSLLDENLQTPDVSSTVGMEIYEKTTAYNAIIDAPIDGKEPKTSKELKKEAIFIPNDEEFEVESISIPVDVDTKLKFISKSSGSYGNGMRVAIARQADFEDGTKEVTRGVYLNDLFEVSPAESRREIAVVVIDGKEIVSKYLVTLDPNGKDYRGKSYYIEDVFNQYDNYFWVKDNVNSLKMPSSRLFQSSKTLDDGTYVQEIDNLLVASQGSDGIVSEGDIGLAYGSVSDNTIFGAKEEVDIDIVISNELARIQAGTLASDRADCIAFHGSRFEDSVGLKSTKIVENIVNDVKTGDMNNSGIANSFNAYFGNYLYIYDKYNDLFRWVNCAGAVSGLRAYTSENRDIWWANAGVERGKIKGIHKLSFNPSKGQRDIMYKNKINPIVSFPGLGNAVIFGQKTLADGGSFSRINVRGL